MFTSVDATTKLTKKFFLLNWIVMMGAFYATPIYTLLIRMNV